MNKKEVFGDRIECLAFTFAPGISSGNLISENNHFPLQQ